jgi:hypothetical protein
MAEKVKSREELIQDRQQLIFSYGQMTLEIEGLQEKATEISNTMSAVKARLALNLTSLHELTEEKPETKEFLKSEKQ